MNPSTAATAAAAPTADRLARDLLAGGLPIELDADDVRRMMGSSTDEVLLTIASRVLAQLRVMGRLCASPSHHGRLVGGIFDLATSYGTAPSAAIGAVATLVDRVSEGGEESLARALLAVRSCFGRAELVAAAVALSAATTAYLADLLGVDPVEVHDEVVAAVPAPVPGATLRHRCRHHERI